MSSPATLALRARASSEQRARDPQSNWPNMPPFKDDQIIVRQSQTLHDFAHLLTPYFRLLRRVQKPPWRSLGCQSPSPQRESA